MIHRLLVTVAGPLVPAAVVVAPTAWLNGLGLSDMLMLTGWLWLVWLLPFAGVHAVAALVSRVTGRTLTAGELAGVMWAALVGGFWMVRLEPAHQWISTRPHLSVVAIVELCLVVVGVALLVAAAWRGRPRQRAARVAVATAAISAVLWATATLVEPTRSRDAELRRATAGVAERPRDGDQPARVLMLAIDGLDWRSVQWLTERGRIPNIAALVARGKSYRLDNRAMLNSPPIWTAMYTGAPRLTNRVGGFEEWHFAGMSRPVYFLPVAGAHPWFMLDRVLAEVDLLGAWRTVSTSTLRMVQPPIWTIASAAGLTVGVFNPVPFPVIGERVNGFFAIDSLDGVRVHRRSGAEFSGPLPGGEFERETAEVALLDSQFRAGAVDLGIFYTHFVDSVAHYNWDFRFRRRFLGGDPAGKLDERFTYSAIADAYAHVDRHIGQLIDAFGSPSVVVLVSDHGWEYNDYEHFHSPEGVLVVAGTGATGHGGAADVLSVAPTVLSLLGLPATSVMGPPLVEVAPSRGSTTRFDLLDPDFILESVIDPDRRQLLRSLGYIRD